jgi:nucleotide-binding universal stress UspA family protein
MSRRRPGREVTVSGYLFPLLVLVTWVALGLAAVVLLGRRGRRSPAWIAIGVVLGPILLPIALELAQRGGMILGRTDPGDTRWAGTVVLAAVDGSGESDDAVADAVRLLVPERTRFVLLTVLDPDDAAHDPDARRSAEELLRSRSGRLPPGSPPAVHEVAMGDPAQVILDRAAADDVDLVVLGRRGRGLSERILGSVADQVVRRSPRPVLLGQARR